MLGRLVSFDIWNQQLRLPQTTCKCYRIQCHLVFEERNDDTRGLQCSTNTQLVLALPVSHAALGERQSQHDKSWNSEHFPLIFHVCLFFYVECTDLWIPVKIPEWNNQDMVLSLLWSHDSAYQNSLRFVLLWKLRT